MGPVQENDTKANVKAIKKIPKSPPLSAPASALFTQEDGNVISNAPKKETAKITSKAKKKTLNQGLVERAFSASAPKIIVTKEPKTT